MTTSSAEVPKVLISYAHESPEHIDRVLSLADRLLDGGVDCHLDQYETSPPEGWPRWASRQIEEADYVLIVCTEVYQRRFKGAEEAGKGLGAQWEGAIITQELYDAAGNNTKFIPVLLSPEDSKNIPHVLRGARAYDLSSEGGYTELYRRLTKQPFVTKPGLGAIVPLPTRERKQFFRPSTWNIPNAPRSFRRKALLLIIAITIVTPGLLLLKRVSDGGRTANFAPLPGVNRHPSDSPPGNGGEVARESHPSKVGILVADFEGPDPQKYGVTTIIVEQLEEARKEFPDVYIQRLGQAITSSEEAMAKGREKNASIVLWGSYLINEKNARVTAQFDVLEGRAYRQNKETLNVAIDKFQTFTIQEQLSKEMAYLTLLAMGTARYEAGDLDGAITRYTAALKLNAVPKPITNPAAVYVYRGVSYHQKGDLDRALEDYNRAVNLKLTAKGLAIILIRRGAAYSKKGKSDLALADCNKAVKLFPDYAQAYLFRGIIHAQRKDFDRAVSDFNRTIELDPEGASGYVRRGMWRHMEGHEDEAMADFNRAISLDPENALAYFQRGSSYALRREFELAFSDLNSAIKFDPDESLYYVTLGRVYMLKGDYDNALIHLTKAITVDSSFAAGYLARGSAYLHKNDLANAVEDLNKAAMYEPGDAEIYLKRGSAYRMLKKFDQALADFNRVIKARPASAEAYRRRGEVYGLQDNYPRALSDLSTAIRLDPADAEAYYIRGLYHAFVDDIARAKNDLKSGRELSSDPELKRLDEIVSNAIEFLEKFSKGG